MGSRLAFFCADRESLVFNVEIDLLVFVMRVENHLVLEWSSNLTSLLCRWSKWTWSQCDESNMTWFQCRGRNWLEFCVGGRKWLVFSVWIEINLVVVSRHPNWLEFTVGTEIDLILVVDQNSLDFLRGDRIARGFCIVVRNWLDFSVGDWTWLDFNIGIGIDLIVVSGSKMTLF